MSGVSGLAGWQWLFLLEGIPSLVMGVATYLYLPDSIERAAWLPDGERRRALSNIALFWTLPTAALRGTSAAAGIAAINSIGNLAGFLSPYLIGVVKDATGEATFGLYVMAVFMLLGTVLVIIATREAKTA